MATVAFSLAGSIIGSQIAAAYSWGAVATAVATAVGSIVGAGIANELFPPRVETERFNDLNITNSAYGLPIPIVYAEQNRIGGNVIWSTGLVETRNVKKVGSFPAKTEIVSYTYSVSFAVALAEGECRNINKVYLNKKLAFDRAAYSGTTDDFTSWTATSGIGFDQADFYSLSFYPGNFTQTPDPVIEAVEGAGTVPAYRGTCYIVFKDLQLKDYGNSLPTVEVELAGLAPATVGGIVSDIMERTGLTVDERGVDQMLYEESVRGFRVAGAGTALNAMKPLLVAYGAIPRENGGAVSVTSRNRGAIATILPEHMLAPNKGSTSGGSGGEVVGPLRIARAPDVDLPKEVTITYYDPDRDYQSSTQRAARDFGNPQSVMATEFPLTLTGDEARKIADRALYEPYLQRVTAQFAVPAHYDVIIPGDLILIPVAGRDRPFRISRTTRGVNGAIEMEAYSDDQVIFGGSTVSAAAPTPTNPLRVTGDAVGYLFNPPLLSGDHTDYSFVAVADNITTPYPGTTVYYSLDDMTFVTAVSLSAKSSVGACTTTLQAPATEAAMDRANTLTVELTNTDDVLSSVTLDELHGGANLAWVGKADGSQGELIQFQTATLVSPGVYTLSKLLRGRRATDHYMATHTASETFVLLEGWGDINNLGADLNRSRYYKFVTNGQDPDDVASGTFTNTGEGGKCRMPCNIRTFRDSGNDISITWTPRTRFFPPGLGYGEVGLSETGGEQYEIDITNSGYSTVYRTISTSNRTTTYTSAQATADGLTPSATRYGIIYQVNTVKGRGHGKRFICL